MLFGTWVFGVWEDRVALCCSFFFFLNFGKAMRWGCIFTEKWLLFTFGDDAIWQLSRFLVNLAACSPRFYRFYDSIQKMNTEESRMDVACLFSQITESSTHGSSLVGLQTTVNRRSLSSVGTWKKTSSMLFLLGGQQDPWQSWYDAAGVELASNQMEIKQSSSQSSHRAFCDKPKLLGVLPPLLFGQESSFFFNLQRYLGCEF